MSTRAASAVTLPAVEVVTGDWVVEQGATVEVTDRYVHHGLVILVLCGLDYAYQKQERVQVYRS